MHGYVRTPGGPTPASASVTLEGRTSAQVPRGAQLRNADVIFSRLPGLKAPNRDMLVTLLVILHVIVCLFLIGVVLIQQGKSADLAGAFGGAGSQTAFGPRGASNLLTRLTTWSAIIFMLTSIGLTVALARTSGSKSVLSGTATHRSAPAKK